MKQALMWPILYYLRFLARVALFFHKPTVIGIAGSVGKSSCRNALYSILSEYYSTKMIGNSETGIPLGILGIEPNGYSFLHWINMLMKAPLGLFYLHGTRYLITEMGIDDPFAPKNMDYLLTIIKPYIAVSLNITGPHLAQFEKALTEEEKNLPDEKRIEAILAKMAFQDTKIITESGCKVGIFNSDDQLVKTSVTTHTYFMKNTKLMSFGTGKDDTISYGSYDVTTHGTTFTYTHSGKMLSVKLKGLILPEVYQEVFAATLLTATACEIPSEEAIAALEENFNLPHGRASIFEGIFGTTLIDSSYNAPPKAVEAFLDLIRILKKKTGKEVVFIMGDMRELGEEAEYEHRKIAKKILGIVDYFYGVGPLVKDFVISDLPKEKLHDIQWFENSKKAGEYLKKHLPKSTLVLIKGSQNTIYLEETVKELLKDETDTQKLCRQEEYWMNTKRTFFSSNS